MFLQGWVNGILTNESSVYGTLCIVLLKILNMGLYFSEIDTRGWPYRRRDLLLPFNHSFAGFFTIYGRAGHFGHVTRMPRTKYRPPYPRRLHIKFGFDRPSCFGEEGV